MYIGYENIGRTNGLETQNYFGGGCYNISMYYPYLKQETFLSPAEIDFYKKLKALADEKNLIVFAKVRLADLVWIPKTYGLFSVFFNKIKAKQIDFVLCDTETFEIKCLVELDDKSHVLPQRHSRDMFINKVIKNAKHPFIRCSSPEHVCVLLNN